MRLDDPELVRAEYADESRFERRAAAWQDVRESTGTVTFPNREAAQQYVDSLAPAAASGSSSLPPFEGELVCSRRSTIFVAEKR